MPNARFRLTEDDIRAAADHHRELAARENPLYSFVGYWVQYILFGVVIFWVMDRLFMSILGGRSQLGYGAGPLVLFIAWMQARARKSSYPEIGAFRSDPMAHAWLEIPWSEAGIECDPNGPDPLAWRKLEKWSEADGMMLIYFRPKTYAVLPRRSLTDDERGLMRGYLEAAQVPRAGKPWWT